MSRLEVLIVDDEPLARERIRDLLAAESDVEIVGECKNGKEAVASLETLSPDLVFLDVQMPDLDGFGMFISQGKMGQIHVSHGPFRRIVPDMR